MNCTEVALESDDIKNTPAYLVDLGNLLLDEHKRADPISLFKAMADAIRAALREHSDGRMFGEKVFIVALIVIKALDNTTDVLGREGEAEAAWSDLIEQLEVYTDILERLPNSCSSDDTNSILEVEGESRAVKRPASNKSPILSGRNGYQYAYDSPIDHDVMQRLFDYCRAFAMSLYSSEKRKIKFAYAGHFTAPIANPTPSPNHLETISTLNGLKTQGQRIESKIDAGFRLVLDKEEEIGSKIELSRRAQELLDRDNQSKHDREISKRVADSSK